MFHAESFVVLDGSNASGLVLNIVGSVDVVVADLEAEVLYVSRRHAKKQEKHAIFYLPLKEFDGKNYFKA